MMMDKIIINTFTIWQMTMGEISTFTMKNLTFPSFAAPNTSSATSCVKLFSCVLHVSPKGRRGGTRVLPGPSLRCSKAQHVLRPFLRSAWVPPHEWWRWWWRRRRRRWWWWLLCVVGSLHLDALEHTFST